MSLKLSNNFRTTLAAAVSEGDTTFTVTSAANAPTLGAGDWCYITIGYDGQSEIKRCTARSGAVFTCPAFAADWPAGAPVRIGLTAEVLADIQAAQTGLQLVTLASGTGAAATNTSAIQAALDAALAAGGGIVELPDGGPWYWNNTLSGGSKIELRGRNTLMKLTGGTGRAFFRNSARTATRVQATLTWTAGLSAVLGFPDSSHGYSVGDYAAVEDDGGIPASGDLTPAPEFFGCFLVTAVSGANVTIMLDEPPQVGAITSGYITNKGTGYTSEPTLSASGSGGTQFRGRLKVVSGLVEGIIIDDPGTGYPAGSTTLSISGGGGSGCAITPFVTTQPTTVGVVKADTDVRISGITVDVDTATNTYNVAGPDRTAEDIIQIMRCVRPSVNVEVIDTGTGDIAREGCTFSNVRDFRARVATTGIRETLKVYGPAIGGEIDMIGRTSDDMTSLQVCEPENVANWRQWQTSRGHIRGITYRAAQNKTTSYQGIALYTLGGMGRIDDVRIVQPQARSTSSGTHALFNAVGNGNYHGRIGRVEVVGGLVSAPSLFRVATKVTVDEIVFRGTVIRPRARTEDMGWGLDAAAWARRVIYDGCQWRGAAGINSWGHTGVGHVIFRHGFAVENSNGLRLCYIGAQPLLPKRITFEDFEADRTCLFQVTSAINVPVTVDLLRVRATAPSSVGLVETQGTNPDITLNVTDCDLAGGRSGSQPVFNLNSTTGTHRLRVRGSRITGNASMAAVHFAGPGELDLDDGSVLFAETASDRSLSLGASAVVTLRGGGGSLDGHASATKLSITSGGTLNPQTFNVPLNLTTTGISSAAGNFGRHTGTNPGPAAGNGSAWKSIVNGGSDPA